MRELELGGPQGSPLSPTFFDVLINAVLKSMTKNIKTAAAITTIATSWMLPHVNLLQCKND